MQRAELLIQNTLDIMENLKCLSPTKILQPKRVDKGQTVTKLTNESLKTPASQSFYSGNLTLINLSDAKFLWFHFLGDATSQFLYKLNFSPVVIHLIPVFYFNTVRFKMYSGLQSFVTANIS